MRLNSRSFMLRFSLLFCCFLQPALYAATAPDELVQAEKLFDAGNYFGSRYFIARIYSLSLKAVGGKFPSSYDSIAAGEELSKARVYFSEMKKAWELDQKDSLLKTSITMLGLLERLDKGLPAERRLANVKNFFAGRSGEAAIEGDREIMTAAYEMGRPVEAEAYAQKILKSKEALAPASTLSEAFNMLGLCKLAKGDKVEARNYLLQSAIVILPVSGQNVIPRLRLAEAMLSAGERDAVEAYLQKLSEGNWKLNWKKTIEQKLSDLKNGRLSTFKPSPIL